MTHVRTSTTVGRRPRGGAPSPPSRYPAGQRRNVSTLTLRCKRHGYRSQIPAQELLPRGLAQRRGKGSHPPDRPAGKILQRGHRHPPVLLQPGRPDPPGRRNRLPWPSWMDISKAFNACKREDYPFVTQVAAVVATGAFRDFGQAVDNWRNPGLRARAPRTKRPAFTGTGSFLAAGSMKEIRYDGKRRLKLPCLGSVKLGCTLPRGICHEASIRRENGRWYICLKLWKPPEPKPERASRPGGIDTGINPLGTDSDGQTYRNPKASYEVQKNLRRWQRAQARRQKGSRGWWEAQRKIDKCQRRIRGLRQNAQHQMTSTVTRKFSELVIEDLNVAGLMRRNTPQGPGRRRDGRRQAAADLQGPVAPHRGDPGTHVVPQQQDLQRLRDCERQPEAGTDVDLPQLRDPA